MCRHPCSSLRISSTFARQLSESEQRCLGTQICRHGRDLGASVTGNERHVGRAVTDEIFREEFLNDLWKLHWSLMTPRRKEIAVKLIAGLKENRSSFPQHTKYLADHQPPALIVWGSNDHYMPEKSARAYLRDLPDAELHLLDGGHWFLGIHLDSRWNWQPPT